MGIGQKRVGFSVPLNWLIAIPVLGVALIVGFWFVPDGWHPMFVFSAAVVGGCAALITATNAVDSRSSAAERERKTTALAMVREWNHPLFYQARSTGSAVMKHFRDNPHINDQKQFLTQDPRRSSNLIDVLNVFESLAVAIKCELADEGTAKMFFRSLVLLYWNGAETWIKARRAERDNTRLYQEMQWLFNRWKD
jgi:hypothetical protein